MKTALNYHSKLIAYKKECESHYTSDVLVRSRDFQQFCRNVYRLLKIQTKEDYIAWYRKLQFNRRRASLEQQVPLADLPMENLSDFKKEMSVLDEQPHLISTFHLGSYRLLPRLLSEWGHKLAIILSEDIVQQQGDFFIRQAKSTAAGQVALLNSADASLFRKIIRLFSEGYHVLLYLDGGKGLQDMSRTKHLMEVPFLKRTLMQRTALFELADRLNYPVICATMRYDEDRIVATMHRRWHGEDGESREPATVILRQNYGFLETLISQNAPSWEGWLYSLPLKRLDIKE